MSPTWIWHVKLIPWSLSTSINFDEHRWLGHLHRPQTSPTLPPHITFQSQIATENRWYPPPCIISIPQPPKSHKRDNEAVVAQYSHQSTGPSSQDHLQNDAPDGPNKGGIIVQYEEIWTSCFPLQQMGLGREKRSLDELSPRPPLAPSPSSFDGRLTTQSIDRLRRVDYHRPLPPPSDLGVTQTTGAHDTCLPNVARATKRCLSCQHQLQARSESYAGASSHVCLPPSPPHSGH